MADRRRLAAPLTVLALVLALAGCGKDDPEPAGEPGITDGGEPADPPGTAPEPEATFEATVTSDGDAVTVDYTLTNDSGGELLAVNLLPRPSGASTEYTSEAVYVTGQDDERVLLSQRVFAWPEGSDVAFEQSPQVGATRLAPGEKVTGRASVPLPLERSYPFGNDLGYGDIALPDPVDEVVFCLGVLAPPYPPPAALRVEDGVTVLSHGNEPNKGQYLFCSDPTPLD